MFLNGDIIIHNNLKSFNKIFPFLNVISNKKSNLGMKFYFHILKI